MAAVRSEVERASFISYLVKWKWKEEEEESWFMVDLYLFIILWRVYKYNCLHVLF